MFSRTIRNHLTLSKSSDSNLESRVMLAAEDEVPADTAGDSSGQRSAGAQNQNRAQRQNTQAGQQNGRNRGQIVAAIGENEEFSPLPTGAGDGGGTFNGLEIVPSGDYVFAFVPTRNTGEKLRYDLDAQDGESEIWNETNRRRLELAEQADSEGGEEITPNERFQGYVSAFGASSSFMEGALYFGRQDDGILRKVTSREDSVAVLENRGKPVDILSLGFERNYEDLSRQRPLDLPFGTEVPTPADLPNKLRLNSTLRDSIAEMRALSVDRQVEVGARFLENGEIDRSIQALAEPGDGFGSAVNGVFIGEPGRVPLVPSSAESTGQFSGISAHIHPVRNYFGENDSQVENKFT